MKRNLKECLAEKIFNIITSEVLDYELETGIRFQWEASLKLNGEDFYEFIEGTINLDRRKKR